MIIQRLELVWEVIACLIRITGKVWIKIRLQILKDDIVSLVVVKVICPGQSSCISCVLQLRTTHIGTAKVNGHPRERDDKRQQKSRQYQDCSLLSSAMSFHVCAFFPKTYCSHLV